MSGHSHAKTIKHAKEITDQKRGQIFSKMARAIAIAVRDGGSSIDTNYKLKTTIDRAKNFNMPNENIDRAIKSASGDIGGKNLSEFLFEAYGPGGIAILIEGITDNKNRVLLEIKQILAQRNSKLAQEGSVRWMFERRGIIVILLEDQSEPWKNKEALELKAIEAGAENFIWRPDNLFKVQTTADKAQEVKEEFQRQNIKVESSSIDWVAKNEIPISETDQKQAEKLFNDLDENNDVQDAYSNLKD
ncbi:YebC/PmpR family DNA-binding transcriptional regulator [Candidatus Parcubacteria bacterium]|nr:YebC/PmpR family DNA-binding transcriptional regulator [Patescibacteria group bacterium]MBU4466873.1 YebC/PmpR family DNA-binding transcriptional regulator [Patescibacteria group bacterium]MCG2688111.1 YebC/PmpR family DNA-binding transcriptional regulator [Candidatus Parcubacteria bacterium]